MDKDSYVGTEKIRIVYSALRNYVSRRSSGRQYFLKSKSFRQLVREAGFISDQSPTVTYHLDMPNGQRGVDVGVANAPSHPVAPDVRAPAVDSRRRSGETTSVVLAPAATRMGVVPFRREMTPATMPATGPARIPTTTPTAMPARAPATAPATNIYYNPRPNYGTCQTTRSPVHVRPDSLPFYHGADRNRRRRSGCSDIDPRLWMAVALLVGLGIGVIGIWQVWEHREVLFKMWWHAVF